MTLRELIYKTPPNIDTNNAQLFMFFDIDYVLIMCWCCDNNTNQLPNIYVVNSGKRLDLRLKLNDDLMNKEIVLLDGCESNEVYN